MNVAIRILQPMVRAGGPATDGTRFARPARGVIGQPTEGRRLGCPMSAVRATYAELG
jgi:hypothetical protein